jgi:hypothetical protein
VFLYPITMQFETYSGSAPSHWTGQEPRDEIARSVAEAASKIDIWYNAGKPFFTRESIQHIYQQLRRPLKRGDKVSIMGLDGVIVDFDIEMGNCREARESHLEYIM